MKDAMIVTMLSLQAGPAGVARPGTVLDVTEKDGKALIDNLFARAFDAERDRKAPRGLVKPPEKFA